MTTEQSTSKSSSSGPLTRFARVMLTMGSGETIWLIVAFVFGAIALGVISNFVFNLVTEPAGTGGDSAGRVVITVSVLVGLAYIAYRHDQHQTLRSISLQPTFDERTAPPQQGLILSLSLGSSKLPLIAINHHDNGRRAPSLKHCWVLVSPDAQEAYETLAKAVAERNYAVELHPIYLITTTIEECYNAVDEVYTSKAALVGLEPDQIIADLTGGLKTMTAGMVLAGLLHDRPLEYVESKRDPMTGQFIEGTQQVIKVGVNLQLSH